MRVIVVGAGEVGLFIADRLSREGHDVAMVEPNRDRMHEVENTCDVLTVLGSGSNPTVLHLAGLARADLLCAVTNSDEVNLVASLIAHQAGVNTTIVRLESDDLRGPEGSSLRKAMGVDLVIDPDLETAEEIIELLQFPGTQDVFHIMGGEVMVLGARLPSHAPMVGQTLQELAAQYEPHWEFLIGTITRGGQTVIAREDHRLEADDLIRVVCSRRGRRQLLRLLGLERETPRSIMILGGGHTARIIAERVEAQGARVTIVERKADRARELAERLDRTVVLHGEITDADLLSSEGVENADVVIATTGSDDSNVLACLYCKAVGAKETIAVVHRLSLLRLVHQAGVDVAISPRTAIANAVLRYVHGGGVAGVTTFLVGEAEILDLTVGEGSQADGAIVAELPLPREVLVGAVVRNGSAEIARGRTKLRHQDRVVAFAMPAAVGTVRRLFG